MKKIKLLIVDDEESFCNSIVDILLEKGFDVKSVNSGNDALNILKENKFDVVLIDIKMPAMDGVETFRQIKKISPKTIVILMTAYTVEELIEKAIGEGAFGCISKPIDIQNLIEHINLAINRSMLILVVDDDEELLSTFRDVLDENGYIVSKATTADEAIKIVRERPQDIVFIDIKLHALNGVDLYLKLKEINSKTKYILVTSYKEDMAEEIEMAIEKGAYACLYKPLDMDKVLDIIKRIKIK